MSYDVLRKMFRVFADAMQKCGLAFVEPRQAEEIDARYSCDPTLVLWHSTCPVCKDWQVNPIEVIPKPICPNDRRDACCSEIEGQDGIGDFLRVVQDFGTLRRWKLQPVLSDMLISSLCEIDQGRIATHHVFAEVR